MRLLHFITNVMHAGIYKVKHRLSKKKSNRLLRRVYKRVKNRAFQFLRCILYFAREPITSLAISTDTLSL